MTEHTYTLELAKPTAEAREPIVAGLVSAFGLNEDAARQLVARAPCPIKRGLPASNLETYVATLQKIGAGVVSVCDQTGERHSHPAVGETARHTDATGVDASAASTAPALTGSVEPASAGAAESTYSLELVGHGSRSAAEVAKDLAQAFGLPEAQAQELLARAPVTLKRGLSGDRLATYIEALRPIGVEVMSLCEQTGESRRFGSAEPAPPAGEATAGTPGAATSASMASAPAMASALGGEPPDLGAGAPALTGQEPLTDLDDSTRTRPRWLGPAVALAVVLGSLAVYLTQCRSAPQRDQLVPVTGDFESAHLGLALTFPEGWQHVRNLDRNEIIRPHDRPGFLRDAEKQLPSKWQGELKKREMAVLPTVEERASMFFRGGSRKDATLSLILSRSGAEGQEVNTSRFHSKLYTLVFALDSHDGEEVLIGDVYCEVIRGGEVPYGECTGMARIGERMRGMVAYIYPRGDYLYLFWFLHQQDHEQIAGEINGIFDSFAILDGGS